MTPHRKWKRVGQTKRDVRDRHRETDRQSDRQTETEKTKLNKKHFICIFYKDWRERVVMSCGQMERIK